ncbi:ABC transporter substrate-binding protein [Arthrobacter sp. D2-10]
MRRALYRRTSMAVAAAGVVALSLAGCASGPQSASEGEGGSGDNTLTWSGFSGDPVAAALIEEFEANNAGTTIEFTGLPYPQILSQINTELVSGTASDIVTVFPGAGNPIAVHTLAEAGYLQDLTSQSWTGNFNEANKSVMGLDGKVYFGANNFTIIPAIYNDQALEALGATAPTTFSEVLELCSSAQDEGKVAYALAGAAGGNFHFIPYALTATLVYGANPDFANEQAAGETSFSDSEWATALEQYKQMNDAGCFTADALGTSSEVAQEQIVNGDAIGTVNVSNVLATLKEAAPDGTTFSTAPFPATDDPSETVLPVGLGAGYGVNAKSDNVELAMKFMDFIMSEEGMNIALETGGIFPSQPVEGYEPDPSLTGVAEQAQSDKTAAFPDQTWPNSAVNQVYFDELQKLLGDQTSVEDALAAMDTAYTQ